MRQALRDYLDAPMDRRGTHCEKWDHLKKHYGRDDLVAMWVADMDFPTVPEVPKAIIERAEHPIYGYTENFDEEKRAEMGWLSRRHGLEVDPDWILYSPGVVDSLHMCVSALTQPGERVLIQPPVYGPFYSSVELFGRQVAKNPLKRTPEGDWRMDYEDMEAQFASGIRTMILCSPHNPVGRVWTRQELEQLLAVANRYGVTVISDEIHADFTFKGHPQTRILSLAGSERCVMLTSATKSFNLAGLRQSSIIAPDKALRDRLYAESQRYGATTPNIFGAIAQTAAYTHGDAWMDAVVAYISENMDYACGFLADKLPEIQCRRPEGTNLLWLDMRGLGMTHEQTMDLLINRAHIAINSGLFFGEEGRGWFRMNLATQRANVVKTLENLHQAIRGR